MALCKAQRDNFIHRSVTLIFTPSYTDIFYNTSFWKCLYVIKNLVECFNWDGNVKFSIPSKAISYRPEPRKHQWTVPTKMSFRRECCCLSWPSVCRQSSGNWDNRYFLITSVIIIVPGPTLNSLDSLILICSFVFWPRQGLPSRAIFSSSVRSSGFLASRIE